jgi:hypothetical protein
MVVAVQTFLYGVAHLAVRFWFVLLFCSLVFFIGPTNTILVCIGVPILGTESAMWYLRVTQWSCWRLKSCGLWCLMGWWIVAGVLKGHNVTSSGSSSPGTVAARDSMVGSVALCFAYLKRGTIRTPRWYFPFVNLISFVLIEGTGRNWSYLTSMERIG